MYLKSSFQRIRKSGLDHGYALRWYYLTTCTSKVPKLNSRYQSLVFNHFHTKPRYSVFDCSINSRRTSSFYLNTPSSRFFFFKVYHPSIQFFPCVWLPPISFVLSVPLFFSEGRIYVVQSSCLSLVH